jgi:hypothetical protein
MNIPTIETERLRLRAFEGGDLEPYGEMYADLFVRYLSGKTLTKEQAWENGPHTGALVSAWKSWSTESSGLAGCGGLLGIVPKVLG